MTVTTVGAVLLAGAALTVAIGVTAAYVGWAEAAEFLVEVLIVLPFALVGATLAWRRPSEATGWLFAACGVGMALAVAVNAYLDVALGSAPGALPADIRLALIGNPLSTVAAGLGFVVFPMVFPDGRPASPRWRWPLRAAVAALVLTVLTAPFQETSLRVHPATHAGPVELGPNPFAAWPGAGALRLLAYVAFIAIISLAPVALASLVARYRRGGVIERLQIRWVVSAVGLFVGTLVTVLVAEFVFGARVSPLVFDLLLAGVAALVPISVGVAVLRYRLYEVDRIVSRTLVYAAVTAVLVSAYVGLVVALQAALRPITGGSDLAVAASTLAVAAAFGPVRRRIQTLVDRRFYRSRYDAARTVESFTHRLRDELHLDALRAELGDVTSRCIQPSSVSLWLPPHAVDLGSTSEA